VNRTGRRAAQPTAGWAPAARRDGARLLFVSEDGRQRRTFDLATLPGRAEIGEELAVAFEAATGPLGSWKRKASAEELWWVLRQVSSWVADHRPSLRSLAALSIADARLLAMSLRTPAGDRRISALRALLRSSPVVPTGVHEALARLRSSRRDTARQPYTADELRRISVVARGIVRRARDRVRTHRALVADYQQGHLDRHEARDPRRCLAEALDHCARTGDMPRSPATGRPTRVARRAMTAAGQSLLPLLHLRPAEAWAFAVLLVSLTGLNASTLAELPAPHLRSSAPGEPGIALVDANKPRRGSRSAMTVPMTAVRPELHPPPGDGRPQRVLNTSLTTAYGTFGLLVELTEPARRRIGSDRAFVFCHPKPTHAGGPIFFEGLPNGAREERQRWVQQWLTGDTVADELLVGISMDRLRKTYLERNRRPVAHTPDTLARYLRRMATVTTEGFQIVRDALDEQVTAALARRRMTVATGPEKPAEATGADTVLGSCRDFDHSPLDGDGVCRRTFLECLDCANARAFPRHLPLQLLVLDELKARQQTVPMARWVAEYAGRAAQLEQIVNEYEPAQVDLARSQISDRHRTVVARLFAGSLDPL
jgi:hypothetical protein